MRPWDCANLTARFKDSKSVIAFIGRRCPTALASWCPPGWGLSSRARWLWTRPGHGPAAARAQHSGACGSASAPAF